jgi:predicted dehydrogenase
MKPVTTLLLGVGSRGLNVFAGYARMNPQMLKITAVAEPVDVKRKQAQAEHGIDNALAFRGWEDAFKQDLDVEAVIIATQDRMHYGPLTAAMRRGLHILCEKPVVPTLEECRSLEQEAAAFTNVFMMGFVLKYTVFFSTIKRLLDQGRIGRLIGINLIENVGHVHMSHSFVRGNWRNLRESSPMILAKSCHDMDMLHWLAGADCDSVSSFGALNFFTAKNAPAGAPERCLDGCPHSSTCPWFVGRIYLTAFTGWPVDVISTDHSLEGRLKALETGPYGRCVFHCDNDVVDHQTVSLRFANGVSAAFTMSGFTMDIHRGITLFGTGGEITGDMEENRITVKDFSTGNREHIDLATPAGGHSGGDSGLVTDFVRMIRGEGGLGSASVRDSLESHYMAFAAERSRLAGGALVKMADVKK